LGRTLRDARRRALTSYLLRDAARLDQERLEAAVLVERKYTAHPTVVTAAHERLAHEECRHAGATDLLGKLRTKLVTIGDLVQLDDFVLGAVRI